MAVKLLALYKQPANTQEFDNHYFNVHVPLAEKMPGLKKAEYNRLIGSPMGQLGYYMLAEMSFDSMEDLQAAMASEEGKAAAKDLMGFAGHLVHLAYAETVDTKIEAR